MTTRCKCCDFTEDRSIPSIFHDGTTDGDRKRQWTEEDDGFICSHCYDPDPDKKPEDGEVPFDIADDWPEDWGKEPKLRKGFY